MKTSRLILLLIGLTGLAYSRSLTGGFVYDDKAAIVKNPSVRRPLSLPTIFGTPYWGKSSNQNAEPTGGLYRPVTVFSFALNYHLFGLRTWTFHLINLALHIGVCLLLVSLLTRWGFSEFMTWAAAFLFALLPVHSEAVSSLVGRAELLSAFFVLVAWIYYLPNPSPLRLVQGSLAFALALLSKENAIAFLPVLIAGDFYRLQQPFKTTLRERLVVWISAALIGGFYLTWRDQLFGSILGAGGLPYFNETAVRSSVMTMAVYFWSHYVRPLVFGFPLCADFSRPELSDTSFRSPGGWLALASLIGVVGWAIRGTFRQKKLIAFGTLIFLIFLAPVSNLFASLEVIGAERFLYLPSLGYVLILAFLLSMLNTLQKPAGYACLIGLAMWYGVQTWQRDAIWRSEASFWNATVKDAPRSPRAWNGLGVVEMDAGNPAKASDHFRRALNLNPLLMDAHYNLATCYLLTGDKEHAKAGYTFVISQRPEDLNALHQLAQLAEGEKDNKSAISYYSRMRDIDPQDQRVQESLARLRGLRR